MRFTGDLPAFRGRVIWRNEYVEDNRRLYNNSLYFYARFCAGSEEDVTAKASL